MSGLKDSQSSKESENEKKDRNRPSISLPSYSGYLLASDLNRSSNASSPSSGGFVTPRNGLSLASHTVPLGGISPVWKYLRIYRAMHRLGELNMQWPSASDAKTTEPGQREAIAWALVLWSVSDGMVVWRRGFGEGLLSDWRNRIMSISQNQHRLRRLPDKRSRDSPFRSDIVAHALHANMSP